MATHHSSTQIHKLEDLYEFRNKVFSILDILSGDKTLASQLAGGLSAGMKRIFKENNRYQVDTEISTEASGGLVLRFRLPRHADLPVLMPSFFDCSELPGKEYGLSRRFALRGDAEKTLERAAELLHQKTKEELVREVEAKNNELNVARSIQASMLPITFPAFPNRSDIDIYAALLPAKEVGGDLYDFYFIDEHRLALVVGDVSGKGVPAALMMAVSKTLLKSRAAMDQSTASILTHVNDELARDNRNYMFVTVFMGILDTRTGALTYTNAGHNPSFIRKSNGQLVRLDELHGPVAAAMESITYRQSTVQLDPGDVIFAYTDGIVEAHNASGELFSEQRLQEILKSINFNSPEHLVKTIIESVQTFEKGMDQFDDLTALCIEYKGTHMEPNTRSLQFSIQNRIEQVQTAIGKFEEFAEGNDLPFAVVMKASVVFDELLSNIVKYSFMDKNVHFIEISVDIIDKKLYISFTDDGIPFNPFQTVPPDLTLPVEEREIGGLGIHLVRELMNEYGYQRQVNRNKVTMIKYLD